MKKRIHINIGGVYAGREPTIIRTLLGSCVAVCLHDPAAAIGGMNHILLPGRADLDKFDNVARYAINAMELLINRLMGLGGRKQNFIAKVFGGAHVLPSISPENGVGPKNSRFVLQFLETESIAVAAMDIGGRDTRRIYFHTDTGEVFLKRIPFTQYPSLAHQEKRHLVSIRGKVGKSGGVTFFDT